VSARAIGAAGLPRTDMTTVRGDLDLLATAVLMVDREGQIRRANQAAELLLDASRRHLVGQPVDRLFVETGLIERLLASLRTNDLGEHRQLAHLRRSLRAPISVQVTASAQYTEDAAMVLEIVEIEQQLRLSRDERALGQSEANRTLLRNLAHEIKNPLGGIRGAAQLLDAELAHQEQREYTRVIIAEADRLQVLVDRVLATHRQARVIGDFNVHEVCERVRSVLLAQYPRGLTITRDYDASMPDLRGDREQLIQAVLNIGANAAHALAARIAAGDGHVLLRTRIARHVTIARRHVRLAAELAVIDNGPGVPEELGESIFLPLVSGRADGSGLGLSLAQALVQGNEGAIEFTSRPGETVFRILLPLP
jgi:two-component system, NtrC family, nitrogen regulation sensor histidine kinase GlnL